MYEYIIDIIENMKSVPLLSRSMFMTMCHTYLQYCDLNKNFLENQFVLEHEHNTYSYYQG